MPDPRSKSGRAKPAEILLGVLVLLVVTATLLPSYRRVGHSRGARDCRENLRELDRAKENWALDRRMNAKSRPTPQDLLASGKYLKEMPHCSEGGRYSLNDMSTSPTCSLGGQHRLP